MVSSPSSGGQRSDPIKAHVGSTDAGIYRAPVGPSGGVFGGYGAPSSGRRWPWGRQQGRRRPMRDGWWGDGVKGAFLEDRAMGMHKLVDSIDLL